MPSLPSRIYRIYPWICQRIYRIYQVHPPGSPGCLSEAWAHLDNAAAKPGLKPGLALSHCPYTSRSLGQTGTYSYAVQPRAIDDGTP